MGTFKVIVLAVAVEGAKTNYRAAIKRHSVLGNGDILALPAE